MVFNALSTMMVISGQNIFSPNIIDVKNMYILKHTVIRLRMIHIELKACKLPSVHSLVIKEMTSVWILAIHEIYCYCSNSFTCL